MRKANKFKRQPNENVQPALVNSAVANAGDPLPEGNYADALKKIRSQAQKIVKDAADHPTIFQQARHYQQDFERRAKAMPFVRFVKVGEALPTEYGNVDKLDAPDGSGTWYMFPTSENLNLSYGAPDDATQGQEAQGGPLHGITGRGEKYAGGNVETEMVADDFKSPDFHGKGSQTGGTGVQRASLGDGSAIGAAVEDPDVQNLPDQHEDQEVGKEAGQAGTGGPNPVVEARPGHLRPLERGTVITQVSKGVYKDEPGIIRRTHNVGALVSKPGIFEMQKPEADKTADTEEPTHLVVDGEEVDPGKPTKVDTSQAALMKEGEKTATDAAAAGAVTAASSAADIEQKSPGTLGSDGGKNAPDASEGTAKDTEQPTVDGASFVQDGDGEVEGSKPKGAQDTGGTKPAQQKSDEATPQTGGSALGGGTTLHIGGKK